MAKNTVCVNEMPKNEKKIEKIGYNADPSPKILSYNLSWGLLYGKSGTALELEGGKLKF